MVLFHKKISQDVYVPGSFQIDTTLASSDMRIGVNKVYVVSIASQWVSEV
jgi:hypothetical protein